MHSVSAVAPVCYFRPNFTAVLQISVTSSSYRVRPAKIETDDDQSAHSVTRTVIFDTSPTPTEAGRIFMPPCTERGMIISSHTSVTDGWQWSRRQ